MKDGISVYPETTSSCVNSLIDSFGRKLDYLRLSVTERCNLRCTYCMPENGVPLKSRDQILTFEEMHRLVKIFLTLGIKKIRITGGEPFVRKGAFEFIKSLNDYSQIESINLTTNAVLIGAYLPEIRNFKIGSLNISLDSLDRKKFQKITLRDEFNVVYENIFKAINLGIPTKINMVVMKGINDDELTDFTTLAKNNPVEIRFIEQMPFNGGRFEDNIVDSEKIMQIIRNRFELIEQPRKRNSTSKIFKIPGFAGKIGIIEGFTRTFCGSCNRLRITAEGIFKTCLYDRTALNFKEMIRKGVSDNDIIEAIHDAILHRAKDGFESQKRAHILYNLSMAQIGG